MKWSWRKWNPLARGRRSPNLEWEPNSEVNPTGEAPPSLDELNELNLHTIQRQSSPRHEVEPMDFGAVSPEFFGASATVKMEMGHHDVESEPNEGTSTWQCGLSSACDTFAVNCCRDAEETVGRGTHPSKGLASRPDLVSTGVQTEPISKKCPQAKGPEEDTDVDVDFRTLLNLAEQRRGRVNDTHDTPQAVPAATLPATLPATCPTRPARARKVSVMPSPDDHFLSLERERRAGRTGRTGKHEVQMRAMSPTSPTSEVEYVYLDPSRYFGSKARGGDTPSQMLVWSLTRT